MGHEYSFRTSYFGLCENELHLLRSGFVYKRIPFKQVREVAITKGSKVKRPLLVFIFGLVLIFGAATLLLITSGFNSLIIINNQFEPSRLYGLIVLLVGFLTALGGIAIFQAIAPFKIIKIRYLDTWESFPLEHINEDELSCFLKKTFPNKFIS